MYVSLVWKADKQLRMSQIISTVIRDTWVADRWKWKCALRKNSYCSTCTTSVSWLYLLLRTATAELSQLKTTLFPCSYIKQGQVYVALLLCDTVCCISSFHLSWNHLSSYHPQLPCVLELSEVMVMSHWCCEVYTGLPFQWDAKVIHHITSYLNFAVRQ